MAREIVYYIPESLLNDPMIDINDIRLYALISHHLNANIPSEHPINFDGRTFENKLATSQFEIEVSANYLIREGYLPKNSFQILFPLRALKD